MQADVGNIGAPDVIDAINAQSTQQIRIAHVLLSQPSAGKKGATVSPLVCQKVTRLKSIVTERAAWAKSLAQVKGMWQWVLDVEHILDASGRSREQ